MVRQYKVDLYSNNAAVTVSEVFTATDLADATTKALAIQAQMNAVTGVPHDFKVKNLQFLQEV
jgi:hypothetical protein